MIYMAHRGDEKTHGGRREKREDREMRVQR